MSEFNGKTLDFLKVNVTMMVHVSDAGRICAKSAVVTIRVCSFTKTKVQLVINILLTEFCII